MNKKFYFLVFAFVLTSCEKTAYDIDAPDCVGLEISDNIAALKNIENQNPSKLEFKVAIVADAHLGPAKLGEAIKTINDRSDIDFIFVLGDITDQGSPNEYNANCMVMHLAQKPILAVIGNHDSISNGKLIWKRYFKAFDYSFSYLGTKFIAYNDNAFEFDNVPDFNFIQRESAVAPNEVRYHTIAASHIPPVAISQDPAKPDVHTPDFIRNMLTLFDNDGIHFTIHGHLHAYSFSKDVHGNPHYVVKKVEADASWGLMTVSHAGISMENCSPSGCYAVSPH